MFIFILMVLAVMVASTVAAVGVNWLVKWWYSHPVKETDEGPHFYLTKEIKDGR